MESINEARYGRLDSAHAGRMVVCRDCTTRSRGVLIPVEEIADHNDWHAAQASIVPPRGSCAGQDLATREAAIAPLLADGWTLDAALNHVEGSCDRAICCGWDDLS
jgi:hypothetical protein